MAKGKRRNCQTVYKINTLKDKDKKNIKNHNTNALNIPNEKIKIFDVNRVTERSQYLNKKRRDSIKNNKSDENIKSIIKKPNNKKQNNKSGKYNSITKVNKKKVIIITDDKSEKYGGVSNDRKKLTNKKLENQHAKRNNQNNHKYETRYKNHITNVNYNYSWINLKESDDSEEK